MNALVSIDTLPIDILIQIAKFDIETYRGMFAIPFFARYFLQNKQYVHDQLSEIITNDTKMKWYIGGKTFCADDEINYPRYTDKRVTAQCSYLYGIPHLDVSKNLPTRQWDNGDYEWIYYGRYHRVGGPAVSLVNGYRAWIQYGQLHREDGPALEHPDGTREWRQRGIRHRDPVDGVELPALERPYRKNKWFKWGKLHRSDGPAVVKYDGTCKWYQDGELHRCEIDSNGKTLPAVVKYDGSREWWQHGLLHRSETDSNGKTLPAIESANGDLEWFQHSLMHRDDGPAMICNGAKYWFQWGRLHRDETDAAGEMLPAVERANGTREWWLYGERHRENGPPVESDMCVYILKSYNTSDNEQVDSTKEYFLHGEWCKSKRSKKDI